MKRRSFVHALALSAAIALAPAGALAEDKVVKVGILHSLSGTMAISETVLKDTALMAIDEINAKGGVMGYKIEAVVVDPAFLTASTHMAKPLTWASIGSLVTRFGFLV